MNLQPNRRYSQLLSVTKKLRTEAPSYTAVIFRSTTPKYATRDDLLSGEGAKKYGGRWNPPGAFTAVYGSLNMETALAEALVECRRAGIPDEFALPRTFVAMQVRVSRMLDFLSPHVQQSLGISLPDAMSEDWKGLNRENQESLTQVLARSAFDADFEALRVPSAAFENGRNLVVFPDKLLSSSHLQLLREDRL